MKEFQKFKLDCHADVKNMSDDVSDTKVVLEQANKEYAEVLKCLKDLDIKRQVEQLTHAFIQDELLSDIVRKSIETNIGDVSHEFTSIQKMVFKTKSQANEEKDKENRSRNIIY